MTEVKKVGAPFGNKNAVGNNGGKPKTYTDEFIEDQGKKLLEWAAKDEALVLRAFAPMQGYPARCIFRWADQNEFFADCYEQAKDIIGARRELLCMLNKSDIPYKKYANWYDEEIARFERDQLEYESTLKMKENLQVSDDDLQRHSDLMTQLRELRESHSTRNKEESSISNAQ